MPTVYNRWKAPEATGWSCSKGGTVSGPFRTSLMFPLLAASTFLANASARRAMAGLLLSQLVSIRSSAASTGVAESAATIPAALIQRMFMAFSAPPMSTMAVGSWPCGPSHPRLPPAGSKSNSLLADEGFFIYVKSMAATLRRRAYGAQHGRHHTSQIGPARLRNPRALQGYPQADAAQGPRAPSQIPGIEHRGIDEDDRRAGLSPFRSEFANLFSDPAPLRADKLDSRGDVRTGA